jgi:uncharacterized protein
MKNISIILSGALFGAGVTVSGMVNPMRILNFFDVTGYWDPTLLFVMGAGLLVTLIGFRFVLQRPQPLFESSFHLPTAKAVDAKLVGGSALFGLGWGLSGFCPGPAVASLVFVQAQSLAFVVAMAAGILLTRFILGRMA